MRTDLHSVSISCDTARTSDPDRSGLRPGRKRLQLSAQVRQARDGPQPNLHHSQLLGVPKYDLESV